MVEPMGALCRQARPTVTHPCHPVSSGHGGVVALHRLPGPLPAPDGMAGKEPVMTATAAAVPCSPSTGVDLRNVGEMSRMSRGLSEMSAQMSNMSTKCRSDVRNVRVHWKPQTAQEVAGP
jgi:hypothetical protein